MVGRAERLPLLRMCDSVSRLRLEKNVPLHPGTLEHLMHCSHEHVRGPCWDSSIDMALESLPSSPGLVRHWLKDLDTGILDGPPIALATRPTSGAPRYRPLRDSPCGS